MTQNAIVAALTREDEDGNTIYSPEQIRHALPYLAVALDLPLSDLSEGVRELIAETVALAGATGEHDALAALRAYYEAHPVDPGILEDVRRALEGDGVARADPMSDALAATGGAPTSNRPVGTGPAPAGSVRGGLAQLATRKK